MTFMISWILLPFARIVNLIPTLYVYTFHQKKKSIVVAYPGAIALMSPMYIVFWYIYIGDA